MKTKSKLRFLRISLRGMLILLTLAGVWIGVQVDHANQQKAVLKWLTEHGGQGVSYDWYFHPHYYTEPPKPIWLSRLIGDEYFGTVVTVTLCGAKVCDLSPLAKLPKLRAIYLTATPVSDLAPMAGLTELEYLGLSSTLASDLTPLKELPNLTWLYLNETPVCDVSPLANLSTLKQLILDGTEVTSLTPLMGLTRLEHLSIKGTPVSEEEIEKLRDALPKCTIERY